MSQNKLDFLNDYQLQGEELKIFTYPHPVLKAKAKPVTVFDQKLIDLGKNMLYTMYRAPGVGLAAPQIGESIRMFVMDVEFEREKITHADETIEYRLSAFEPHILVNPKVIHGEGEIIHEEGCLSVPGVYEKVKRFDKVIVEYQDLLGNPQTMETQGIGAVCVQHEIDHLDGIVFLERLSVIKRNLIKKKYLKDQNEKD